jgi:hypothetical protein
MHGRDQRAINPMPETDQVEIIESIENEKIDTQTKSKKKDKPKSKSNKSPTQPRIKRGPARPHRRLAVDVIDSRITKLQNRLDRAKAQIDDAGRHVEGYLRERDFRAKEA